MCKCRLEAGTEAEIKVALASHICPAMGLYGATVLQGHLGWYEQHSTSILPPTEASPASRLEDRVSSTSPFLWFGLTGET